MLSIVYSPGSGPRPSPKGRVGPPFPASLWPSLCNEIKVNSDELNRCELYLYRCHTGGARKLLAPLLKQRTYQPQGWPTLIFENSIVGFSGVLHPPPFPAHAGPTETTPRDLEQAIMMAKPISAHSAHTLAISREPQPLAGPQHCQELQEHRKMLRHGTYHAPFCHFPRTRARRKGLSNIALRGLSRLSRLSRIIFWGAGR